MYLTPEVKQQIFTDYGNGAADTGSAESQVALFTHRIKHLTEHLKQNKKDLSTKRSLINLVGKRRRMLDYLKQQDIERYRAIVKKLGIRK
ncbi:MAG: 30S ribosomal protein S15 [Bacteroidales bacterium]|jgi:small subunit ribosomal protein S15|nr:30S ribosomal protein S15 [Bacteroidales bacterium]